MSPILPRAGRVAVLLLLLACSACSSGSHDTTPPAHRKGHHSTRPVATPPTSAQCRRRLGYACYSANQLRRAYDLNPLLSRGLTGKGVTVAIVDSFGSPTIRRDLAAYDRAFHLPPPPSFRILAVAGRIPTWNPRHSMMLGWAGETTLDVEAVHAMAPGASILLVETPVAETLGTVGFPQMIASERYVLKHHLASVISQSFGAGEATFPNRASLLKLRRAYKLARRDHVTILASSGDGGPTGPSDTHGHNFTHRAPGWPATDPLVTAVGGTHLRLDAAGRRTAPDSVWNESALGGGPAASAGGRSQVFGRPNYQRSVAKVVGAHRGMPDISMDAARDGGFLMYAGFNGAPGFQVGRGTSLACPLFAGVVAIADQAAGHSLGFLNPSLYRLGSGSPGIPDVTRGNTTVTFVQGGKEVTVRGFPATPGYDLATGLGTVDATQLVRALKA